LLSVGHRATGIDVQYVYILFTGHIDQFLLNFSSLSNTKTHQQSAKSCDSRAVWPGIMKGSILLHCVAGQNAIRDKDAKHNCV